MVRWLHNFRDGARQKLHSIKQSWRTTVQLRKERYRPEGARDKISFKDILPPRPTYLSKCS
jgi:hypothetical protein